MLNTNSLDGICAALAYALGVDIPKEAAPANEELIRFLDEKFGGRKADRVVMYNPDAVAQWIYEKYPEFCRKAKVCADIEIPLRTVMPSVTPVCFGTMYTGAQPEVHGIRKYEKPVIRIDTLFDSLIRAGKKPALITYGKCSLSRIYLERDMDYFHYETGDIEEVNAKAAELILRDEHDFILIYNGNYDSVMHKHGPESPEALAELRLNAQIYSVISHLIENNWTNHRTLLGFAMDHGCHEIDGGAGSHGLDMEEDLNIVHLYRAIIGSDAE
ncbi:MAG: alkaline phosphatase family protein [Clostridia bacterium]|nr:alkaline phosphatase family protein [Clostridia bacterium]